MALIRLDVNAEMSEVNSFLEKADAATVNLANHAVAKASKNTTSANVNKGNFVASADTTSLLANLHDQSVSFPRGSVFFSNGTKWGRFRPGGTRSGKGIMTKFLARANSTFPQSEREAISYWEKEIREAEKG